MEYLSALIYVLFEKEQNKLKTMLNTETRDIDMLLHEINKDLKEIKYEENSKTLFMNIKFIEFVDSELNINLKNVIFDLIKLILELDKCENNGKDMLAKAYEYILTKSAKEDDFSSRGGVFYTPSNLIKSMVEFLDIKDGMGVYNPACGTGNFLVESARHAKIYAFGEEKNISNYNICITNLWLHNVNNKRIKENEDENMPQVDIAIANPPFKAYTNEKIMPYNNEIRNNNIYLKYLFMMLEKLHHNGKMAILLPQGFLFKKAKSDYNARKELINKNYIEAIINLPEKMFYDTKISVILLIINKNKKTKVVQFIDASKEYESGRKSNVLTEENQNKILQAYREPQKIPNFSYLAEIKEIEENDYDLNIKKYIQIHNENQYIDTRETQQKIEELERKRREIEYKISELLSEEN